MNIVTLPRKQYRNLIERQERVEKELGFLREVVRAGIEEEYIRSATLKRWERISRDLDRGRGRVFSSLAEMRAWLKQL